MNILENQIEERKNLLSYFISQKAEATINKLPTDALDRLINITTYQLVYLLSKELEMFFSIDLSINNTSKYLTEEGIKREAEKKELKNKIENLGLLPINTHKEKRILVIDVNYLSSEYEDKDIDTTRKTLETIYDYKVLLIDGSRQNTQGLNNSNPPAYFI